MTFSTFRFHNVSTLITAIALSSCSAGGQQNLGVYRQSSYRDSMSMAYNVLPQIIRVEPKNLYEAEWGAYLQNRRLRGSYRFARDTLFFDEGTASSTIVSMAAHRVGDTLFVRMPGLETTSEGEIREPIRYVRRPRRE